MEAECESEVQVASVAIVQSSEEETLSAESQETEIVETSSSENNIETSESQETSQQVSVSVSKNEFCVSFESEATYPIKSVTKTEDEIVRESSEFVEVEEDLKTQETSEQTEEETIVSEAETQSSGSVTQKASTIVSIRETDEISEAGVEASCATKIVITDAEGSCEVQRSFVSTKEILTNSNYNEEKMESVEDKSSIEIVHEESSEEKKEIIESNQCMEMQAEEQTSLEVEKIVSDEKIICQVNEANDADEVQDTHDEVPGGEADEQSATPDLIKACNEINKTMNGSANIMEVIDKETTAEVNHEDIIEERREDKIQELSEKVHSSEILVSVNKKKISEEVEREESDKPVSSSANIILNLTPAPVVVSQVSNETNASATKNNKKSKLSSSSKLTTVNGNTSINKKVEKNSSAVKSTAKASTAKTGKSGKVKVAGKTVDFNSDKAQYLNLTIDQIQELAIKQKNGEFQSVKEINHLASNGDDLNSESHCLLHNDHKNDAKKFNTLPRRKAPKKDISQSPDLVKEAEASNGRVEPTSTTSQGKNTRAVARSRSFNLKSSNDKRSSVIKPQPAASDVKQIAKKGDYKSPKGGGLFAPTQSWLLKIENARESGQEDSMTQTRSVRSSSQARQSKERSVSPRRRIREASVRSDKSDTVSSVTGRSDSSLSDNKTKTDRAALRSTRAATKGQDDKKKTSSAQQKGAKNDVSVKKQATKMTQKATETESKKTESEEIKTCSAETVTSEASESIQEESVEKVANSIDESSESANTVIKKFENKISEVSRKSSFRQSSNSTVIARSRVSGKVEMKRSTSTATSSSLSATTSAAAVTEGSIKTSSVSKPSVAGVRRAQSMKSESRDKIAAARAKTGQGSVATNNPHSNSNGLSRTGAAKKQQHLDTNGKGSSTKMVMGKNSEGMTNGMTRTTLKVKLHPGEAKRFSAYLEGHENSESGLLALNDIGVSPDLEDGVIQGLEISFTSLPQDIDIKILNGDWEQ